MRGRLRLVGVGLLVVLGASEPGRATPQQNHASPQRAAVIRLAQAAAKKKTKARKTVPAKPGAAAPATNAADEGLKFSRDIAPILVANCTDCHNPQRRRGKFDLTTFQKLMAGSDKNKVILPGNPDESLLVGHIKGEVEPKMPPGNRELAPEAIARIEAWVKAGALLDAGVAPTAELKSIAPSAEELRKAELAKLPSEERDKRLLAAAKERFKKAGVTQEPEMTSSASFALFGNLPADRASHALKTLEAQHAVLNKVLSRSAAKPAFDFPEKISVYVLNEAGLFVEFARSVENREVESGTQGLANFVVEHPYLAVVDPLAGREDESLKKKPGRSKRAASDELGGPERTLDGLLAEQLGQAAIAQHAKAPRWLALGLGAYVGSQVEPRSPYYRHLRELTVQEYKLGWQTKAQEALGDAADADRERALGFSLVDWLASSDRVRFGLFARGMLEGTGNLDKVIGTVWDGASREAFLNQWGTWVAARYGRGR